MVGIPSKNWKGISQCSYWIDFVMGSCFLNRFTKKISREWFCGKWLRTVSYTFATVHKHKSGCTNTKAGAETQNERKLQNLKNSIKP